MSSKTYTYKRPSGQVNNLYLDMLKQPHLMIAGATGSGKSVVVNALIYTALYGFPFDKESTDTVKYSQFILVDPKRVELVQYKDLPHTLRYAYDKEDMLSALKLASDIIEDRYTRMAMEGASKYQGSDIYVIIDEFADLMLTNKKRVAPLVQHIAQVGRAAKVHMILCTQCPIREVIPTAIKANFDARLGLRTRSVQDSRNILGFGGCEKLPRFGGGCYMTPDKTEWTQIPMVEQAEIDRVVNHWLEQK